MTSFPKAGAGFVLTLILLLGAGTTSVAAAPTPSRGPAAGDTQVADQLPEGSFVDIETGESSSYAIDSEGRGFSWGYNYFGELGNSDIEQSSGPWRVPSPMSFPDGVHLQSISGGSGHGAAVDSDGGVWTWGRNDSGQLGLGDTRTRWAPERVTAEGVRFVQVAAGFLRTWALDSTGRLWGWGQAYASTPLGDGTAPNPSEARVNPVLLDVSNDVVFVKLAARSTNPIALSDDGRVWLWGDSNGLTMPGAYDGISPKPHPGLSGIAEITRGPMHAGAVGGDGNIRVWGDNFLGAFGDGTNNSSPDPQLTQLPEGASGFASVAAGWQYTVALTKEGQVYAWGSNQDNAIGVEGLPSGAVVTPQLVTFPGGEKITKVVAGNGRHTLALTETGRIYAWGLNDAGQAGAEPEIVRTPRLIPAPITDFAVSFGGAPGKEAVLDESGTWTALTPGGCGPVDVEVNYSIFGAPYTQSFENGFTYGTAPAFSEQPSGGAVKKGETFSTSAAVVGDPAPILKWQRSADGKGDWIDVDQEGETLRAQIDNTTFYRAVAESCFGVAESDVVEVKVIEPTPPPSSPPASNPPAPSPQAPAAPAGPKQPVASGGTESVYGLAAVGLLALLIGGSLATVAVMRRQKN